MCVSGVEEGRRYIEKTVSKHSEMVESIRQLSDGLMQLEAKLKVQQHRLVQLFHFVLRVNFQQKH